VANEIMRSVLQQRRILNKPNKLCSKPPYVPHSELTYGFEFEPESQGGYTLLRTLCGVHDIFYRRFLWYLDAAIGYLWNGGHNRNSLIALSTSAGLYALVRPLAYTLLAGSLLLSAMQAWSAISRNL